MHVFAGFESNQYVEMAINDILKYGVYEENIVFVEMENQEKQRVLLDSINYSDGRSFSDSVASLGTIGMLLGVIYGSVVYAGPVATGLLGLVGGGLLGYFLDRRKEKKVMDKRMKEINLKILLIVKCHTKEQQKDVIEICRKYFVSYIGKKD